jgi:hypothetical protein
VVGPFAYDELLDTLANGPDSDTALPAETVSVAAMVDNIVEVAPTTTGLDENQAGKASLEPETPVVQRAKLLADRRVRSSRNTRRRLVISCTSARSRS